MTDNQEEEKKTFQVVDRRRFDATGNERKDGAEPARVNIAEPSSSGAFENAPGPQVLDADDVDVDGQNGAGQGFRMEPKDEPEGEVSFTSFVMSLATQTLVQLGEMESPQGMEIPVDVESARQTIDVIQMLQRKTRGNLSPDEGRFIEEVLHTLRMSYVRRSK